jgi:high affinity cAMP-specific and IBMX-insensitive 3',5'-cyclic phosphodiesterase 8
LTGNDDDEATMIAKFLIKRSLLNFLIRRASCSISKSQIGFIEFIIQDMMNAWDGFIDMPELVQYMQYNYTQWKLFGEQGINTLNDIKRKQMSITNSSISNMKLDEMM